MTKEEIDKLTYDQALEQLKLISSKLENKEISIDDLTEQVKVANMLTDHCKVKLNATEEEIKKIIHTDLPENTQSTNQQNEEFE